MKKPALPLTPSAEDYLEAIWRIQKGRRAVRLKHISAFMDVSGPSVNAAIMSLVKRGLARHEKYGYVELTAAGNEQAEQIANRHEIIVQFLHGILGIDLETSRKDACRIEHAVSPKTVEKLAKFTRSVDRRRSGKLDAKNFFHGPRAQKKKR